MYAKHENIFRPLTSPIQPPKPGCCVPHPLIPVHGSAATSGPSKFPVPSAGSGKALPSPGEVLRMNAAAAGKGGDTGLEDLFPSSGKGGKGVKGGAGAKGGGVGSRAAGLMGEASEAPLSKKKRLEHVEALPFSKISSIFK